ncbi:MAG: cytochrome P450 [Alphaproteobacteria bacterium]|nr:MAG: cytochrome P450 [Alphaproteobacteria bacterium]
MQLSQAVHAEIEARGESFVPPYPHRRTVPAGFWELYRLFRENMIATFSAADYHDPLIRARYVTVDLFTINDPELVKSCFQAQHEIFQAKTPQMRHALRPLLGDGLFVSDRELWAGRRAAVHPIIHASRTRDFAPIMVETIEEWRGQWAALGEGASLDVLSEMAQLTAEVISRTIFGRRLGRELTGEVVRGFSDYQAHVDQVDWLSLIGLPDWVPRFQGPAAHRALRRVHRVIDDVIERFARGEGDETAVIGQLFKARDGKGRKLSRRAIRNEAIVIFMAGHETTANTLAWAWYLVSQSLRVRAQLHAELDAELGGRSPGFDDLRRLGYTRAIIEETLRLYPPVPILGRQALAEGEIGGHRVRKGALVMVSPFMLHRRPEIWSMPDHFVPERFGPGMPRPGKYAYIPFAIGPRICPGLTFGLSEAILTLATLAQHFELELEPGHAVEAKCRLTLRPGDGLPMRLRLRG